MVLHQYRELEERLLAPITRRAQGFNPNTISVLALVTALLAALFFYTGGVFLLFGSLFVIISSFLDMFDGDVARSANKMTRRGDFLDNVGDRYADILIIGGLVLGQYNRFQSVGFLAIIGVVMISFVGVQARASGAKQIEGGLLCRATRNIFIIVVPILQYIAVAMGKGMVFGNSLIEWLLLFFVVFAHLTAFYRVHVGWKTVKGIDFAR